MIDDLVRRLRAENPNTGLRWSLASESADRIEEMAELLKDIYSKCDCWSATDVRSKISKVLNVEGE